MDSIHGDKRTWQELRIPVPYGHLAAKAWGAPSGRPVLGLHGWLDNANTFDKIAPMLPADIYLVCLDFSGHGRSSHLGPGAIYSRMVFIMDVKYAVEHLGWKTCSILAHSLGAMVAIGFTGIFPWKVEQLALLDIIYHPPINFEQHWDNLSHLIETFQQLDRRELSQPLYLSKKDALSRAMDGHQNLLSEDSARILLERGTATAPAPQNELVYFTRDHRVRLENLLPHAFHFQEFIEYVTTKLNVDTLFILGETSYIKVTEYGKQQALRTMYMNCRSVKIVTVDSGHHLHLESPEEVAKHLYKFFNKGVAVTSRL